ncbi:MAG TPA: hypothetical protein VKR54_03490 [Candidatus Babeliales bacterium]|jgi:hypothetical protein|nr:hypothetical protein [Candidatus Babeliales bacterium]
MKNRHKRLMIVGILSIGMSIGICLQACMTTLMNDSGDEIRLLNKNDEKFIDIPKNKKRRLDHAHFVIYTRQPKTKMQVFNPAYECQQNACGSSGNLLLKFSDIKNNSDATHFFTIVKHKPHSSMVQDLPMIQKTEE